MHHKQNIRKKLIEKALWILNIPVTKSVLSIYIPYLINMTIEFGRRLQDKRSISIYST